MSMLNTSCPDVGTWRAWLDHELPAIDLEPHLRDCAACSQVVAELRTNAQVAQTSLHGLLPERLPSPAEMALARERLHWRQRAAAGQAAAAAPNGELEPTPVRGWLSRISTPWRIAGSSLAAAIALSLMVVLTPGGQAAAEQFLGQFRSQQVTALEVSPQSQQDIMEAFQTLSNLGTLQLPNGATSPREVSRGLVNVSLQEASQRVGFTLLTPDPKTLPSGIAATPQVRVLPASTIRFTFNKQKAETYLAANGHPNVQIPDKFDGATLIVQVPTAALLQYEGSSGRKDALLIGESGELVVDAQGNASLDELRDFLLGLPGLPATTVAQLKQINNWSQTLPIPIPVDKVHWQSAQFPGGQGLLLNDNTGVASAAIWQAGGHLYGMAGTLPADQLHLVANSLTTH